MECQKELDKLWDAILQLQCAVDALRQEMKTNDLLQKLR